MVRQLWILALVVAAVLSSACARDAMAWHPAAHADQGSAGGW